MSPTLVPAPPAPFGNACVAGHTVTPRFTGTALPGAARSSLGKEGKEGQRHGEVCSGVWCLAGWDMWQEPRPVLVCVFLV